MPWPIPQIHTSNIFRLFVMQKGWLMVVGAQPVSNLALSVIMQGSFHLPKTIAFTAPVSHSP
jgi:hypothetical protein